MSWLLTLIISIIFALATYFLTAAMANPAIAAAAMALTGVLIGRALAGGKNAGAGASSTDENQDVTTLFVGNLAFKANRHQVQELFAEHGYVKSVRIVNDRHTRKPKGYGFVEVGTADLDRIIKEVNGLEYMGRQLTVSVAKEKR